METVIWMRIDETLVARAKLRGAAHEQSRDSAFSEDGEEWFAEFQLESFNNCWKNFTNYVKVKVSSQKMSSTKFAFLHQKF